MPRYRITVEYDGTPFVGWQIQAYGTSVQGVLMDAVHAFSGQTVSIRGAGRTDSGVHATGQVAHFDLEKAWEPFRIREAMNYYLKGFAAKVLECEMVDPAFDARFSASARHYLYRILCRRAPPVLERDRVWWLPIELDAERMAHAARVLLGKHDFTTFRASACQAKSAVRTLDRLDVTRSEDEIRFNVSARSFLHNQVRSMVGSLKWVGEGKWDADDLRNALEACDRKACGQVAPSTGLYLTRVEYGDLPKYDELPDDDPD